MNSKLKSPAFGDGNCFLSYLRGCEQKYLYGTSELNQAAWAGCIKQCTGRSGYFFGRREEFLLSALLSGLLRTFYIQEKEHNNFLGKSRTSRKKRDFFGFREETAAHALEPWRTPSNRRYASEKRVAPTILASHHIKEKSIWCEVRNNKKVEQIVSAHRRCTKEESHHKILKSSE